MGTTADKLNKILDSKAKIKAAIEAKGVADVGDVLADYPDKIANIPSGASNYELESQSLFLKVNSTTVTLKDGKTAAVASNDHIKIVDENLVHYTLKEWNDRSVANGFDNSLVAKPIGFSLECNGVRTIVRWQWTGKYYSPTGAGTAATDTMQHSIYDYNQITAAATGKDATIIGELDMGTGKAGTHFSDDWEVRDNGDTLILYSGNTKQTWEMAKDCGNVNSMIATNFKERTDAMWAQNEWMRHRFAISSGIATDQPDGTMKEVQILNVTGTQPQVGEDMYFYIDGTNTNLLAKYNLNNKHNGPADCFTTAIAEYIYEQQKANGVNMNDTGVNSAEKQVLVPGAKGAEAIAVNGYWYIVTPYISRPGENTAMEYNVCDSPAVYYVHSLQGDLHIIGDRELYPIQVNKSIITGLVNYLRTNEERDSDIPSLPLSLCWSAVLYYSMAAWYDNLGYGVVSYSSIYNRYAVFPAQSF